MSGHYRTIELPTGRSFMAHVPTLERETAIHLVTLSRLVPHKQIEHAMDTVARMPGAALSVI